MQQTKKIVRYLTISWLVASLMLLVGCNNSSTDTGCPGNKNPWGNCEDSAGGSGGNNAGGSSSSSNTGGSSGSGGNVSTSCEFPLAQCYSGPCTDLRTDKDNCGACGFNCGDAATCVNSVCKTICQPTGPEVCDGKDNNCDGNIDEGLKNLCDTCGVVPAEVCDGLDNNCNGTIDEGCPCQDGNVKPCGTTLGECTTGSQKCIDGEWSLCSGKQPAVEICDGKDNNCDGTIDNGCECVAGDQRSCGTDLGSCSKGMQTCVAGHWSVCSGVAPVSETCNGADDNCDGNIDEGCPCTPGATQSCSTNLGECTLGQQTCVNGSWTACSGVLPAVEVCDGKDNNCDGIRDNGCECVAGDQRSCGTDLGSCSKGMQTCVAGHWSVCSGVAPVSETCNGADDNCDGNIDEGCPCTPGATQSCSTDLGECTLGQQTCVNGSWSACSGVLPAVEVCDGKDNNCDGNVDDNLRNACGNCGPSLPDTCNGVDDDCDGTIDNGCTCQTGQTKPCGSTLGTCTLGIQTCVNGNWSLCSGNPPQTDVCGDGKDNDCNGSPDQGCECVAGDSRPCGTDLGECTIGVQTCNNQGHWGACNGVLPSVEACDGLDNNCDGIKDNGCPCQTGATMPCGENLGICTAGIQTCVNGSWSSCSGVQPTQEKCATLLDENCNGLTDEPGCTP